MFNNRSFLNNKGGLLKNKRHLKRKASLFATLYPQIENKM